MKVFKIKLMIIEKNELKNIFQPSEICLKWKVLNVVRLVDKYIN